MKLIFLLSATILMFLLFYSCEKKATIPVVTTTSVREITTTTAVSGGEITDDGGAAIITKGICWNTSDNPTLENNKTTENLNSASFTSYLSQLTPGTSFFVRAYATNNAGTAYGTSVSFKTLGDKPLSTASNASEILTTSATLSGIVNPNSLTATVSFEYGLTTSYGSSVSASQSPLSGGSDVNVSVSLTGINPGKTYHFRIKSENSLGITYSDDKTFTTLGQIPAITTIDPSSISISSVKLNSSVNPNYLTTSVIFEWGIDSNYGNTVIPAQSPINGSTSISLSVDLSDLTKGTKYYYQITATNELGTTHTTGLTFTTFDVPKITTKDISEIKTTSATCGGDILSDFGSPVTERGICWNTSMNPTTSDNKLTGNLGGSSFTMPISNLTPNSTYYLRAYAINSVGISYGNELLLKTYTGTVSDVDGNQYYTVTIGSQLWMSENLKTTKYNNGYPIGTTNPANKDISAEINPKYQWAAGGDEANAATYGRIYTWYAITDNRNLCPSGWHVATDLDWSNLEVYLINNSYKYDGSTGYESYNKIGKALSYASLWVSSNVTGSIGNNDFPLYRNKSGFSALPAGGRGFQGLFNTIGYQAVWWTTTEDTIDPEVGWARIMNWNTDHILKNGYLKAGLANPVRCIKD